MITVTLPGNHETTLNEAPDPKAAPGEVVLRMKAAGICEADLLLFEFGKDRNSRSGRRRIAGHECSGVVAEVGKGVNRARVGDRVLVNPFRGCGYCSNCLAGWFGLCMKGSSRYGFEEDGGLADYMRVQQEVCVSLPEQISHVAGVLVCCSLARAYAAISRMPLNAQHTMLIHGLGSVGISATLLASAFGIRVTCVDSNPKRLALAEQVGAHELINNGLADSVEQIRRMTNGRGVDAVIETTGDADVWGACFRVSADFGTVCVLSERRAPSYVLVDEMVKRHLTITGSNSPNVALTQDLIRRVCELSLPVESLITGRYPLEDADIAFSELLTGAPGKQVFEWD